MSDNSPWKELSIDKKQYPNSRETVPLSNISECIALSAFFQRYKCESLKSYNLHKSE